MIGAHVGQEPLEVVALDAFAVGTGVVVDIDLGHRPALVVAECPAGRLLALDPQRGAIGCLGDPDIHPGHDRLGRHSLLPLGDVHCPYPTATCPLCVGYDVANRGTRKSVATRRWPARAVCMRVAARKTVSPSGIGRLSPVHWGTALAVPQTPPEAEAAGGGAEPGLGEGPGQGAVEHRATVGLL